MGAGPPIRPRCGMQAMRDRGRHQLVIGGLVLDDVDAVAIPVVGLQHRSVGLGQAAQIL